MSIAAAKIDFSLVPVIEVARQLLGDENRERSNGEEKHFPDNGGLFVNVQKNRWYSHGNQTGGDAASLVRFVTSCDFQAALSWLRTNGFLPEQYQRPPRRVFATYDYVDADGEVVYHVDRYEPKGFSQWREIAGERVNGVVAATYERSGSGPWYRVKDNKPRPGNEVRNFPAVEAVPYRLPDLLKSDAPVLIPGGEKDVDNLRALGFTATTNHGGEGKWWAELTAYFRNRRVFILCDNDEQGDKHQAVVGAALDGVASEIRVVRFPELPKGRDVSDWIKSKLSPGVGTKEVAVALGEIFRQAPLWTTTATSSGSFDSAQTGAFAEWQEPIPLPEGLSPVKAFDLAFLPAALGPWIGDISERMHCPPDFAAIPALTALGSVIGLKVGIGPEQKTDWYEVANQWGLVIGSPGVLKSPSISEALKPLHRLEVSASEAFEIAAAAHAQSIELLEMRRKAARIKVETALKRDPKATVEVERFEDQREPIERRYVTNDTSYEKLGELLVQNPNGLLAHRDEMVSLLNWLGREENTTARAFFLTAWAGKDGYKFDRIARGKTHVKAAILSLIGSTQPPILANHIHKANLCGDGMMQRFGLLVWPDQQPEWKIVDRYPNTDARDKAWQVFKRLDEIKPEDVGAQAVGDFGKVPILRFDLEAGGIFNDWRQQLETRNRSGDLHHALEAHFSKYNKLVPSLALINHLADGGTGPIGKVALLRALSMIEYLETHAKRAYGAGPEAAAAAAKAIVVQIRKKSLTDGFSLRDVLRPNWSRLRDREVVQAGLDMLVDHNWLAEESKKLPGGGRPTVKYLINPGVTNV
jgi:hypothetical protein